MRTFNKCLAAAACSVVLAGGALATPYPTFQSPAPSSLGASARGETVTLTVSLKLRDMEEMESLLQSIHQPGSAEFGKFLTTEEFSSRFGPSAETLERVTRHFEARGFAVTRTATAQLQISAKAPLVESEFGVHLQSYQVAASNAEPAYRFRAPDGAAHLPADIADSVQGVLGLSTRPHFHPNILGAPKHAQPQITAAKKGSIPDTTDPPGEWTVVDFAQYYHVEPLYDQGITGTEQTIGIVTLANFRPSDALAYWASLGLHAKASRIKQIEIDGGPGAPSDISGSDETTLDVEQSGGVAPGARVFVYQAPNTSQGFIDAFAKVVDQNVAETVSVSWGEWEWLDTIPDGDVTDPVNGRNTTSLHALHDVLLQAALQGQSFFASSGDAGAYDANDPAIGLFLVPQYNKTLSVDDPAAQQYITAAGGTTLPGPQEFLLNDGNTYTVTIATEQAWGWDYLTKFCKLIGYDPVGCGIFPGGGGGGVSSYVPLPFYQWFTPGISATPYAQELVGPSIPDDGITLPVKLPGGYLGRNVPDISVNADPDTGYVLWYTSSAKGSSLAVYDFYGGTSFSAPQLNGVTSLLNQGLHHRVGLLNFALYGLALFGGTQGPDAPLRDIRAGDNWYWHADRGYDQATGLGVPNVSNLLEALQNPFY